jgi:hypothetical protein
MTKTRWGLSLAAVVVMWAVGVFGLSTIGSATTGIDRVVFAEPERAPAWVQRIALVDAALGRADVSRAVYEWREAYGAATRTKGFEGLIAVADRAMRIEKLSGGSSYFRTEASYVYVQAALRAHAQGSTQAIRDIADKFEKLGDTVRATQMRRLAGDFS